MNWGFYAVIGAAGLLSWLGVIEDRTAFAVMLLTFGIMFNIGISEWEQRSKDTHERLRQLQAEVGRLKEATLNMEAQIGRMSRQMSQWQ